MAAGAAARRALDEATSSLLRALGSAADDVTFTPGASPALWLAVEDAIARVAGRPACIAATAAEHPALLSTLHRAERDGRALLTIIPVGGTGAPALEAVQRTLSGGVDLLCTMAANNEVGTISDIAGIGALAAAHGVRHLVDASQAAGRLDPRHLFDADLVVISGAKLYGPRRSGALIGNICANARVLAPRRPRQPGCSERRCARRRGWYQVPRARRGRAKDRPDARCAPGTPAGRGPGPSC